MSVDDRTLDLLRAWHGGDRAALQVLLEQDRDWILDCVRRKRGPLLKRDADTIDHFQDLMVEVLEYAPRFLVANRAQFRSLMARMIANLLTDRVRWIARRRPRDGALLQSWAGESRLCLDPGLRTTDAPGAAAVRAEEMEWLRLGMEFLDENDRRIVHDHKIIGRSFVDIAADLEVAPNAVRMRCNRALLRLAGILRRLQTGGLDSVLADCSD